MNQIGAARLKITTRPPTTPLIEPEQVVTHVHQARSARQILEQEYEAYQKEGAELIPFDISDYYIMSISFETPSRISRNISLDRLYKLFRLSKHVPFVSYKVAGKEMCKYYKYYDKQAIENKKRFIKKGFILHISLDQADILLEIFPTGQLKFKINFIEPVRTQELEMNNFIVQKINRVINKINKLKGVFVDQDNSQSDFRFPLIAQTNWLINNTVTKLSAKTFLPLRITPDSLRKLFQIPNTKFLNDLLNFEQTKSREQQIAKLKSDLRDPNLSKKARSQKELQIEKKQTAKFNTSGMQSSISFEGSENKLIRIPIVSDTNASVSVVIFRGNYNIIEELELIMKSLYIVIQKSVKKLKNRVVIPKELRFKKWKKSKIDELMPLSLKRSLKGFSWTKSCPGNQQPNIYKLSRENFAQQFKETDEDSYFEYPVGSNTFWKCDDTSPEKYIFLRLMSSGHYIPCCDKKLHKDDDYIRYIHRYTTFQVQASTETEDLVIYRNPNLTHPNLYFVKFPDKWYRESVLNLDGKIEPHSKKLYSSLSNSELNTLQQQEMTHNIRYISGKQFDLIKNNNNLETEIKKDNRLHSRVFKTNQFESRVIYRDLNLGQLPQLRQPQKNRHFVVLNENETRPSFAVTQQEKQSESQFNIRYLSSDEENRMEAQQNKTIYYPPILIQKVLETAKKIGRLGPKVIFDDTRIYRAFPYCTDRSKIVTFDKDLIVCKKNTQPPPQNVSDTQLNTILSKQSLSADKTPTPTRISKLPQTLSTFFNFPKLLTAVYNAPVKKDYKLHVQYKKELVLKFNYFDKIWLSSDYVNELNDLVVQNLYRLISSIGELEFEKLSPSSETKLLKLFRKKGDTFKKINSKQLSENQRQQLTLKNNMYSFNDAKKTKICIPDYLVLGTGLLPELLKQFNRNQLFVLSRKKESGIDYIFDITKSGEDLSFDFLHQTQFGIIFPSIAFNYFNTIIVFLDKQLHNEESKQLAQNLYRLIRSSGKLYIFPQDSLIDQGVFKRYFTPVSNYYQKLMDLNKSEQREIETIHGDKKNPYNLNDFPTLLKSKQGFETLNISPFTDGGSFNIPGNLIINYSDDIYKTLSDSDKKVVQEVASAVWQAHRDPSVHSDLLVDFTKNNAFKSPVNTHLNFLKNMKLTQTGTPDQRNLPHGTDLFQTTELFTRRYLLEFVNRYHIDVSDDIHQLLIGWSKEKPTKKKETESSVMELQKVFCQIREHFIRQNRVLDTCFPSSQSLYEHFSERKYRKNWALKLPK